MRRQLRRVPGHRVPGRFGHVAQSRLVILGRSTVHGMNEPAHASYDIEVLRKWFGNWILDAGIPDEKPPALTLAEICTELVRRQDSESVAPEVVRAMLRTYAVPVGGNTKWTATYGTAAEWILAYR